MSTDLEQQLRGAMERFTGDVRVPPGLAQAAYRHRQKRRVAARAAASAGTAAVVAGSLAAAGAAGAFGSASGRPVRASYTTYVVSHVEHALASSKLGNLLQHDRTVYAPGSTLQPDPTGLVENHRGPGAGPAWKVGSSMNWSYHGTTRFSAFTPAGQRVFDLGLARGHQALDTTAVLYGNRTWWKAATGDTPPGAAAPPACIRGREIVLRRGQGNGLSAFIQSQLACGAYTVVGHQVIGGINTIKISGASGRITFWVNPATYLPVQLDFGSRHTTFQWLAPTPANLAQLTVAVPPGFQQVTPPPLGGR